MKITAFVPTYNEEKRIKYCLQCLKWCDEVFILDKSSTDKTVAIAKELGATVKIIPHEYGYDPHEMDYMLSLDTDWIVLFTCSDLIDKSLAIKVRDTLKYTDADVIYVPFKQYVLGINKKSSPWYAERRRLAFRKSVVRVNNESVHGALFFSSSKILDIESVGYMYHLTHETVDRMMNGHIRYWRGEAECFYNKSFKSLLKELLFNVYNTVKRGAFWHGWDIFALACAYLSYVFMSFVYVWEKKRSNAPELYDSLREEVYKQWI